MKHTKGWLIFWIIFQTLICLGWLGVGIYWGIYNENILVGAYFWLFSGIFLIGTIKDICELVKHNYITREALYELHREDVENIKEYFRKEWDFRNE